MTSHCEENKHSWARDQVVGGTWYYRCKACGEVYPRPPPTHSEFKCTLDKPNR